uniref:RNA polymerase III subunit Rpc25 domain-containing protein n=1 Tax=Spongospora subterranea TaxID=70186 RepID=A0A0H5RB45_9EUKA|eukprot:CRZ10832.1 hypothetical protein [Spongospora subterranea]
MFIEIDIRDVIRLPAPCIVPDIVPSVHMALQEKYANKVLRDQGLCICIRNILYIGEPLLFPGDGGVHVRIECSLILFRPFVHELLIGSIRHSDSSGILVSFHFSEDIFLPKDYLPEPSVFDEEEKLWYWKYLDNNMYMDVGEEIRLRVLSIEYNNESKDRGVPPPVDANKSIKLMADLRPSMRVFGTIAEDGLGLVNWWQQTSAADDDV